MEVTHVGHLDTSGGDSQREIFRGLGFVPVGVGEGWGITVVEQGLKNPPQHEILSSNCVQSRLVLNTNNPIRLSFLQILFHQNTKEIIQMYIIYLADLKSMYMYLNMNIIYCMNPI